MNISVIIPTIGRPESLRNLLDSLYAQSDKPDEILIADGSGNDLTASMVQHFRVENESIPIILLDVTPPNAVRQRREAIRLASSDLLLLLDDDVVLEPDCIEQMLKALQSVNGAVAVCATFNNQWWAMPTRAWRLYLRLICRIPDGQWQGRVIGPLLRFGFTPQQDSLAEMEWLGSGMSMVRRSAYDDAGGFSDFFLHRCTTNEDVDLGIKLRRVGKIIFCPSARLGHFHAPGGRVSPLRTAEDDLYNRFCVMRYTQQRTPVAAFYLVMVFFSIETISSLAGSLRRLNISGFSSHTWGRVRAINRILLLGVRGIRSKM